MCAEGGIGQLSSALDEGLHFPYPTVWGGGSGCHPPQGFRGPGARSALPRAAQTLGLA